MSSLCQQLRCTLIYRNDTLCGVQLLIDAEGQKYRPLGTHYIIDSMFKFGKNHSMDDENLCNFPVSIHICSRGFNLHSLDRK